MGIEIEIQCGECGRTFTPTHLDYVKACWRHCPGCREGPKDPDIKTGIKAHHGPGNSSQGHSREIDTEESNHEQ
jgi:hypothetical protein